MATQTLDERLIGKQVYVEVKPQGAIDHKQTILYWGTYAGIQLLGTHEVIVLEKATHHTGANVGSDIKDGDKTYFSTKMQSKTCYINLDNFLSIDEEGKWVKKE